MLVLVILVWLLWASHVTNFVKVCYMSCVFFVTDLSSTITITGAVNNSDVSLNDGSVVLVCHADGHPSPTYRWLDISSGEATDGSKYTLSTAGEYSLECTASNDVTFANDSVIPRSVSAPFYVNGMFQFRYAVCAHYSTCALGLLVYSLYFTKSQLYFEFHYHIGV